MGGAETSLYYLVKNLDRKRYNPIVICPQPGSLVDNLRKENVPTIIIKLPSWRKFKSILSRYSSLRKLIDIARLNHIQLIHANTIWINHYAQKVGKRLGIPVICHLRDIISKGQVRKYNLHKVDFIIPISDAVSKPLLESNIDRSRIRRVYNGVDIARFSQGKKVISTEGYLIGIVGQLNPRSHWKGQREFIRSAAEVCKQRDDVYFAVVGGDDTPPDHPEHGSYIRELEELSVELGIREKVIFTGQRDDMPDVMASLDILVSASYAEPFGRVIIEAMASGKPVIATSAGGVPEIVQDGITGILVPPKDCKSLANAMLKLLQDKELMKKMGNEGKKRAHELFNIEKNISEIQLIYEAVVSSKTTVLSTLS